MDEILQTHPALDWLEQTSLGVWVASSPYGYYIMLAFHSIGLAMLVGMIVVIAMTLLGVNTGVTARSCQRLLKIAWWGFAINALSGVALFFSEANKMFFNTSFRWKILLVFIGVVAMAIINRTVLRPIAISGQDAIAPSAKTQPGFSLTVWLAVIVIGRMIAYL